MDLAITGLTATTSVANADLLTTVVNVSTTPANRKITYANFVTQLTTSLALGTMATQTASNYYTSSATDTLLAGKQATGSYATLTGTETLTNKRITARTGTTTSSATPTINTDNVDFYSITALAVNITSFTTSLSGTPTTNQKLHIAITGTATRTIAWGASFQSSTVSLPTTTSGTDRLDIGLVWTGSIWRCLAVA